MTRYSAAHWGVYEVAAGAPDTIPHLSPLRDDPDPHPIGLDQLDDGMVRLRITRPAIRKGWLDARSKAGRGEEPFVEVPWDEALDIVAQEIARVRRDHGNAAIFGGSYGWASARRFHHAQSQLHRFYNVLGG